MASSSSSAEDSPRLNAPQIAIKPKSRIHQRTQQILQEPFSRPLSTSSQPFLPLSHGSSSTTQTHLYYYPSSSPKSHGQAIVDGKKFQATNAYLNRLLHFVHRFLCFRTEDFTDSFLFGIDLQPDERVLYIERPQYTKNILIICAVAFLFITMLSFTPLIVFNYFFNRIVKSSMGKGNNTSVVNDGDDENDLTQITGGGEASVRLLWTQLVVYGSFFMYAVLILYFILYRLLYLRLYCTRYILTNKRAIITGEYSESPSAGALFGVQGGNNDKLKRKKSKKGKELLSVAATSPTESEKNAKSSITKFFSVLFSYLRFSNTISYQSWAYEEMSDIHFCIHNSTQQNTIASVTNQPMYHHSQQDAEDVTSSQVEAPQDELGSVFFGYKIENRVLPFSVGSFACPTGFIMIPNVYRVLDIILQQPLNVPAQARLVRQDFQDCPSLKPVLVAKTASLCGFHCFKRSLRAGKISEDEYKGYTHNYSYADTIVASAPATSFAWNLV